jgi:hypothetical protein
LTLNEYWWINNSTTIWNFEIILQLLRPVTVWVLGEQSVVGLFKADQGVSQNLALIASLTRAIASIKAELNPNK